jgi:hypothetical protein
VAQALVAEKLAATAEIFARSDPDGGLEVLARLHTRSCHVAAIGCAAEPVADLRAYPLQCHDDYRTWVLHETRAPE